mgnify:CR=1 FL=1
MVCIGGLKKHFQKNLKVQAITFIIHGSSKEDANVFAREMIRTLFPDKNVNLGFLEVATPSIPVALKEQADRGATSIRIIPLFLVPGNHVTRDIPKLVTSFKTENPQIKITVEPFLGEHPDFKKLLLALAL